MTPSEVERGWRRARSVVGAFLLGGVLTMITVIVPYPLSWRGLAATFAAGGSFYLLMEQGIDRIPAYRRRLGFATIVGALSGLVWWLVSGSGGSPILPALACAAIGVVVSLTHAEWLR